MNFDSPSVLRQLRALQQQVIHALPLGESLAAALDSHDRHEAGCAAIDARRHVLAMVRTAAELRAQVVPADGLGAALGSLSELVLRAVRMLVLRELGTLRAVILGTRPGKDLPLALDWGEFWGLEDLTIYVRDELRRITDPWSAYRALASSDRAAYRAALREAHALRHALGSHSALARFLCAARTSAPRRSLREPCKRMSAALTIRFDVDPDVPLLVAAQVLHEHATERAS